MELTIALLKLYLEPYVNQLEKLQQENSALKEKLRHATSCDDLYGALAKAQAAYKMVRPNRTTQYWGTDYEDFDAIMQASREGLSANGLSLTFYHLEDERNIHYLVGELGHESGQRLQSRMRINPEKDNLGELGSLIGKKKRLIAQDLLGISIAEDPLDDDGERAMAERREIYAKGTALNHRYNKKNESYERISKEQLEELEYEIGTFDDLVEEIYKAYKIESLADLPKSKYREARNNIVRQKNARQGL